MEVKVVESELIQDVLFEIKYDEKYKYRLFVNGEWVDKRSWASLLFAHTFKDRVIRVLMDIETGILYPTLAEKQLHKGVQVGITWYDTEKELVNEFILPLREELLSHLDQWEATQKSITEWDSLFLEEVAWVMNRINEEMLKHLVKPKVKEVISCINKDLPKEKWYKYIFNQSFICVDRQDDLTFEDKLDILETYQELPDLTRGTHIVDALVSLVYKINDRFR